MTSSEHDTLDPEVERLAAGLLDPRDTTILGTAARLWDALDPVPEGLVERAVFAVALDEVMAEVASIQRLPQREPTGVRGMDTATSMTFTVQSLTVMVTVSEDGAGRRRLDGWITPGSDHPVQLRLPGRTLHETAVGGRFSFAGVPTGMVQLAVGDTDTATSMVTPVFQL